MINCIFWFWTSIMVHRMIHNMQISPGPILKSVPSCDTRFSRWNWGLREEFQNQSSLKNTACAVTLLKRQNVHQHSKSSKKILQYVTFSYNYSCHTYLSMKPFFQVRSINILWELKRLKLYFLIGKTTF